ncbi:MULTISPECIES: citrate/2-methylcitrate synthase [unclassified Chelatococcus]|uniref:citrate/2-methylcitrate synthase n=1 Tax=unclassified Chelatococcus TaxID=2638111 RepID=UPI0025BB8209|nr:citrate/2-methylcitrate synthase [Chelatococcus sp.]MCO5079025.1 citrate synthase [Chelatococcus sp.]
MDVIDAGEAVERLGVSRATLYAYVSRGLVRALPDTADPRRSLYSAADIDGLVTRKRRGRKPERIAAGTLDWGLPVLTSHITRIEGGQLSYRGRDALELAKVASFEAVAALLWGCGDSDPFAAPMPAVGDAWDELSRLMAARSLPERCGVLLPLMPGASATLWRRELRLVWPNAATLLRTMAAAAVGRAPRATPIAEVLAEAWGLEPGHASTDHLRAALVLLADHELNASAFAVRVVASTGASLAAALTGGLAALGGPRHGGTTSLVEILFDEIERAGDAGRVVDERLWRGDLLPGFDHPLYPDGDPRAVALLGRLPPDGERDSLIAAVGALGKRPNVDFALVSLRRALGLPRGAAFTLFAVGRTAGWIAHALEQLADGRLIRPRARYDDPEE